VGLLFFHGSPDAPEVDILANGGVAFDDVSFGEFAGYANIPAASYEIDVTPANDNGTVVAAYEADLSFWKGRTAVIFASGFLSGDSPAFEPWVALDNGGTFPLAPATSNLGNNGADFLETAGNLLATAGAEAVLMPNPATDWMNLTVNSVSENRVRVSIVNLSGQLLLVRDLGMVEGTQTVNFDLANFENGTYFVRIENGRDVKAMPFQVAR
jgi:hypothetical protein